MSVPLSLRIPNPPADFVGRDDLLARVSSALRDGPAVVLVGQGGIGKTALALSAAKTLPPGGLFVRLPEGTPEPFGPLLRALSEVSGQPGGQGLAGVAHPDEKLARAIDLADALVPLLVVDDAHASGVPALSHLVNGVIDYAQRARWLFTSREELPQLSPTRQLTVDRLPSESLSDLAARWAPELESAERARALRRAEGSPFRLMSVLRGELPDRAEDPAVEEGRQLLALLRRPVRADQIGLLPRVWEALEERGLLVRRGPRVSMHDAARPRHRDLDLLRSDVVSHLLERIGGDPDATLEQIRLRLLRDEPHEAAACLEAEGPRLIEEGFTPELATLVPPDADGPLQGWGLRIAAEHGEDLHRLSAPGAGADLATEAAWLEVRYTLEDRAPTVALADAVAARGRAEGALEVACRADLIGASTAMMLGDFDRATTILAAARPVTPAHSLQVTAVEAMIAALHGDAAGAEARLRRVEARIDETAGNDRGSLLYNLALVFHMLKRPLDAARLLERAIPDDELTTTAVLGRRMLEMDAHLAVLAGNLPRAERRLKRMKRFVPPGLPTDGRATLVAAHLDLLKGRLPRAKRQLERALAVAEGYGGVEDLAFGRAMLAQLCWREDRPPDPLPKSAGVSAAIAAGWNALAVLSHEGSGRMPDGVASDERADIARLHSAIEAWLTEGKAARAHGLPGLVERETAAPHALVWAAWAAEVRIAAGGAFAVDGALALARSMGASEFESALETLALVEAEDVAAVIAHARSGVSLARSLVGGGASGQLRASLLARLRAHLGWGAAVGALDPSGLVVDEGRGRVYAAGGEVRFRSGAKPLSLLGALAATPKGASKEALNQRVWGTEEYHPLRHDNRLRVAARKLRKRVEPLLESPLLDTLEDGYVLTRPVRWLSPR